MTSPSFSVDAQELQFAARQAFTLSTELSADSLPRGALDGIAGSADVEAEYGAFFQHWSDGLLKASNLLFDLSDRLGKAADDYLAADRAITHVASVSGQPAGAGADGPRPKA